MKNFNIFNYLVLAILMAFSTTIYAQNSLLCMGHHWSEDKANRMMEEFEKTWDDRPSWEERAERIRRGIIEGMKLDQMPEIEGSFNARITNTRLFDGYIVENIVIQSFPGFYITGNLYRPANHDGKADVSVKAECPSIKAGIIRQIMWK